MELQFEVQCVGAPETYWNPNRKKQKPNEDRFHKHLHFENGTSICHSPQSLNSDSHGTIYMVTGAHKKIAYCYAGASSVKQQKYLRSSPQFQVHSMNTPAAVDADHNLLALQQQLSNSNSSIFNNINRISKLPMSLATIKPTFEGKSEKVQLFENLFGNTRQHTKPAN